MAVPTVVIVDDAAEVRALVRTRLRFSGRLEVVAEGSDGAEAVELAERHRPSLMLLDVSMPGTDGLQALPRVCETSPDTRVVMYSGFAEEGLAHRTRELGAAAFFEKSTSLETLVDDLLEVLAGESAPADRSGVVEPARGHRSAPAEPATGAVDPVLEEHLERFREVFEDAAIGMATMTLSGRVVRANRSLGNLLGRRVDELVGTAYADLAHEQGGRFEDALVRVTRDGEDVVQVEHPVREDGRERLVLATLSPVRDARDRALYLFLQVQDVTDQRKAEEELRRSEERFRLIVEAVEDYAIFMLDPDGMVASWNSGAQRNTGYTAEQIIGRHFRTFYPAALQASRHPEHELELAIRDGHYEEEGWRLRSDGNRFWAHVTITAVRDADGELIGFAKVTRDTTERMKMLQEQQRSASALAAANTQLESANERLRLAAEEQAHFLAVTAHELRAPVGVLGMTAETLSLHWDDLTEHERTEFLDGMKTSATQLRRLLADLLTASRLQASALDLHLVPIVLADQLAALAATARRSHPEVEISVIAARDVVARADPGRLVQAVDNLVGNAIRHGASPIEVEATASGDLVEIAVRDAGPGVSPEMQGRLFERFASGSAGGTGLGLYIVRELARAQGGDAFYRPEDRAFVASFQRDRVEVPGPAGAR